MAPTATPCAERAASLARRVAARGVIIDTALLIVACRAATAAPDIRPDRVRDAMRVSPIDSNAVADAILADCRTYARLHGA